MADDYTIRYEFLHMDRTKRAYDIRLDRKTISFQAKEQKILPPWTELESNQCTGCPLKAKQHPHCPIAVNISDLVREFKNELSYGDVTVIVTTPERTFSKECKVQEGLFSILGIVMATSNCPVMGFLKPMARFHLPFSTHEETIVRSTSFYLLRQYFVAKKGGNPDLELKKLDQKYAMVQKVNEGILKRINSVIEKGDADKNAVVILNAFAQMLTLEIDSQLNRISYLFEQE